MINKDNVKNWIGVQLETIGATIKPSDKANSFTFVLNGETYTLHHRHKNEKGSILFHLEPKDLEKMIDDSVENTIPCLAFSIAYTNKDTEKNELFMFISTIDNIYYQAQNKYNTSIKLGEKTGNYIFKYGTIMEKYILDDSCDILTSRLVISK